MVTMHKLISLGISGKVGKWIYSFLTHRTQQVIVNKSFSKPIEVKSGVPQGSVLGPLIFLILIGDIDKDINEAFLSIQNYFRRIFVLCTTGLVTTTWSSMSASLSASDMEQTVTSNNFPTSQIQVVLSKRERSLKRSGRDYVPGWYLQEAHPNYGKTAQNQCSWILRTFMTREVIPMLTLWKSLVQCKLDYCSQLWSPARKGDIQAIEMVQTSFLRKLPAIRHMSYWQKLKQLKLYSHTRDAGNDIPSYTSEE